MNNHQIAAEAALDFRMAIRKHFAMTDKDQDELQKIIEAAIKKATAEEHERAEQYKAGSLENFRMWQECRAAHASDCPQCKGSGETTVGEDCGSCEGTGKAHASGQDFPNLRTELAKRLPPDHIEQIISGMKRDIAAHASGSEPLGMSGVQAEWADHIREARASDEYIQCPQCGWHPVRKEIKEKTK